MLSPSRHRGAPLRALSPGLKALTGFSLGWGGESCRHGCHIPAHASQETSWHAHTLAKETRRVCVSGRVLCSAAESDPQLKWCKRQRVNETRLPHLCLGRKGCIYSAADWEAGSRSAELVPPVFSARSPCSTKGRRQRPNSGLGPRHRELEITSRVGLAALCCRQGRCHLPVS